MLPRRPLIAASVGPYGASLGDGSEFQGNYDCSSTDLVDFHAARLRILEGLDPDFLACETLPSLLEAEIIVRRLRASASVKAWFSFACRDGLHTVHGERVRDCARVLNKEAVVAAIGVNCTAPGFISSHVGEIRSQTNKPIVVYPNAGQTWNAEKRCWAGRGSIPNLGELAKQWLAAGANWIGGCCGFGPNDIRSVSSELERNNRLV